MLRQRRAKAKVAGLPTVAPAACGGNGASAPGPGTEDKDSAFAWQERTLLPVRRRATVSSAASGWSNEWWCLSRGCLVLRLPAGQWQ